MTNRIALFLLGLSAALALVPVSSMAQGRGGFHGGGVPSGDMGIRGARGIGREGAGARFRHNFNEGAFLYSPYLFPYDLLSDQGDYGYGPVGPGVIPPQAPPPPAPMAQPAPPPAPPAEPLLLEIRDGQWVRVPTGNQLPLPKQVVKSDDAAPGTAGTSVPVHPGMTESAAATAPVAPLPPATIVFRDGHTETVGKYMIQGHDLFTSQDYWTTGAWSRKIPLSDLDIPATLKLSKERGTKFSLPSSPSEIVIRF